MSKLSALAYQKQVLGAVSRSFAFTIPQLPLSLQISIANAYLLCRIADTIEDDTQLNMRETQQFNQQFLAVLEKKLPAADFSQAIAPCLSTDTSVAEHDLLANTAMVVSITHDLTTVQQQSLIRCVRIMSAGMADFQSKQINKDFKGLKDVAMLADYCYYVAGVVGEMLSELFCDYDKTIEQNNMALKERSVAFGQGLQMTNILKDIWDDRKRGICWLPADIFKQAGFDLTSLAQSDIEAGQANPAFKQGITQLLKITLAQLDQALAYSLLIPQQQRGIRRFCIWAIAMAVLTLRNIAKQAGFYSSEQVKISRYQVRTIIALSYVWIGNDQRIKQLYQRWTAVLRD